VKIAFRYDDLIGVPYVKNGRSLHGIDCAGLAMLCYQRSGIPLLETQPQTWSQLFEAVQEPIEMGDLVTANDKGEEHVFIALDQSALLHVHMKVGVVLARWSSVKRIATGIYRWKAAQ
jgi:cell wall-associated NlpC family hydrolase